MTKGQTDEQRLNEETTTYQKRTLRMIHQKILRNIQTCTLLAVSKQEQKMPNALRRTLILHTNAKAEKNHKTDRVCFERRKFTNAIGGGGDPSSLNGYKIVRIRNVTCIISFQE
ncbi:hypothetical protein M514_05954 [Trichuris suis]|uniref:Uncharacterized protein n=1 Tax=Trichuris suis TaxID=68888 RepID=A0A085N7U8_9BILA|nr:hypothetical protein M513_05954 [Trichuris suis]KFD65544.1 hypothetical protein M514_05954 [Trichuris suis]KHJ45657.1 hypothetical protein D918_03869 [Trichuris suis]